MNSKLGFRCYNGSHSHEWEQLIIELGCGLADAKFRKAHHLTKFSYVSGCDALDYVRRYGYLTSLGDRFNREKMVLNFHNDAISGIGLVTRQPDFHPNAMKDKVLERCAMCETCNSKTK